MLQESKVLLHSANPLTAAPALARHSLLFHEGLWDGGCPVQNCEVEHTCPSMSQYSTGSPKPRLTAYKALSVTHCPSFHLLKSRSQSGPSVSGTLRTPLNAGLLQLA